MDTASAWASPQGGVVAKGDKTKQAKPKGMTKRQAAKLIAAAAAAKKIADACLAMGRCTHEDCIAHQELADACAVQRWEAHIARERLEERRARAIRTVPLRFMHGEIVSLTKLAEERGMDLEHMLKCVLAEHLHEWLRHTDQARWDALRDAELTRGGY